MLNASFRNSCCFVLLLSACGTETEERAQVDAGTRQPVVSDYKTCERGTRVGGIDLILKEQYTTVQGTVANGVMPSHIQAVRATEGDCQLLRPKELFCDPACAAGTTCNDDGSCIPLPSNQNVGTVQVTGLSAPVEMEARPPVYFYNFVGDLPHPGFTAGATLGLSASGEGIGEFTLGTVGVAKLEVSTETMALERDQNAVLDWSTTDSDSRAKMVIEINIANHGGTPGKIWCETEDTGHFEISSGLVNQLLDLGYSGFPSVGLTRQGVDSTQTDLGCVEFRSQSTVVLPVAIPGLTSCSNNDDCPDGQLCQVDLTCG